MTSYICFDKFWKFPQRVHSPWGTPKPNRLDVSLCEGGGREGASLKMEVNINVFFPPTGLIQAVIERSFVANLKKTTV